MPGLGPKTARKLCVRAGVQSADDLRVAAEQGRLAEVQGLGPKTEEKVLKALAKPKAKVSSRRPCLAGAPRGGRAVRSSAPIRPPVGSPKRERPSPL